MTMSAWLTALRQHGARSTATFASPRSRAGWGSVGVRKGGVRVLAGCGVTALTLALAGCGADTTSEATDEATLAPGAEAKIAAALDPYVGHPSAFPVDEPLTTRPPSDATIAYLQCAAPTCALVSQVVAGATQALGVQYTVTKAGPSAQAIQQAAESILAARPDAVIIPAVDPSQYRQQLAAFEEAGIPVVSLGVNNTEDYSAIKAGLISARTTVLAGKLMAARVLRDNGPVESVFYAIPELDFSAIQEEAYTEQIREYCPSCNVRAVKIPFSQVGSTAPATIVSDLQSHPATKAAVFVAFDAAIGLPNALEVAGLEVDTIGFAPSPDALEYLKDGDVGSGMGMGLVTAAWTAVDAAARLITDQPLAKGEAEDWTVLQLLEQEDITFDPAMGFAGYPDVAERFAQLWGSAA